MLRTTLAVVVALLALAGAWLLLRDEAPRNEVAAAVVDDAPADEVAPSELVAPPREEDFVRVEAEVHEEDVAGARAPRRGRGALEVHVRDAAGLAIQGARVQAVMLATEAGDASFREQQRFILPVWARKTEDLGGPQATTDARGVALLERLPFGEACAKVSLEGTASEVSAWVPLTAERPRGEVDVVLGLASQLVGSVNDLWDRPRPGFEILIQRRKPGSELYDRQRSTKTDADGRFGFVDLTPGRWVVRADLMSGIEWTGSRQSFEIDLEPGRTTQLDLPRIEGTTVLVRGVVRRNGEPQVGAMVAARGGTDESHELSSILPTDEQGRFARLLDSGGQWTFTVNGGHPSERSGGLLPVRVGGTVGGGLAREVLVPQVPRFELDLDFATGSIAGRVLDRDGAPVPGARVRAIRDGESDSALLNLRLVRCDDEGRYSFDDLEAGTYSIQADQARDLPPSGAARDRLDDIVLTEGAHLDGIDIWLP